MASLANLQLLETRPLPNSHFNATEVDAVLRDIFLKHRHVANKTILEKYNQKEYGNSDSDYNEKETQRFVNLFQDVSESCSDSIQKKESEEKSEVDQEKRGVNVTSMCSMSYTASNREEIILTMYDFMRYRGSALIQEEEESRCRQQQKQQSVDDDKTPSTNPNPNPNPTNINEGEQRQDDIVTSDVTTAKLTAVSPSVALCDYYDTHTSQTKLLQELKKERLDIMNDIYHHDDDDGGGGDGGDGGSGSVLNMLPEGVHLDSRLGIDLVTALDVDTLLEKL